MAKVQNKKSNTKFTSRGPIKKTYDFYKTVGNLWESKYLASKKISRYYHEPKEEYLTGPNSPTNLSYIEAKEFTSTYYNKAISNVKESNNRLDRRKFERKQIQSFSKQIPHAESSSLSPPPKPYLTDSPISKNAWENLKSVPISKLRHILPDSVLQKDRQGIDNIFSKSSLQTKQQELQQSQKEVQKLKGRLYTIERHSYLNQLESLSGINKVRKNSHEVGLFGYIKTYRPSERIQELSLPRRIKVANILEQTDFKGLIHTEYSSIVDKIQKKRPELRKSEVSNIKDSSDDVVNTLQDIQDFEKRFHQQGFSNY